jgi:NAD(P)-dependent dehydrogenase (short-subunit alcohol dehydrogenase family)
MFRLDDRAALVTGAARGVGAEMSIGHISWVLA